MRFVLDDGFAPTRLNPACFPTADELNAGTGAALREREARLRAKLARTRAFVSPLQAEYAAREPGRFLRKPSLSEGLFAMVRGERVPADYLSDFEWTLYKLHVACAIGFPDAAGGFRASDTNDSDTSIKWYTDVLMFDLCVTWRVEEQQRALLLGLVVTRPCAEMLGFFRLFLRELARNCVHYGALLVILLPYPQTREILARAWPHLPTDGEAHELVLAPAQLVDATERLGVAPYLLQTRKRAITRHTADDSSGASAGSASSSGTK